MKPVSLVLPRRSADPNSARAYYWCASLLLRMGHAVDLRLPGDVATPRGLRGNRNLRQALADLRRALPRPVRSKASPIRVVVAPQATENSHVQVWASGWTVWLNRDAPAGPPSRNPLVAAAVGTAAAAAVHQLARRAPAPSYMLNLWTMDSSSADGPPLGRVRLPRTMLAGVGAVGGSFVLALAGCDIQGRMHIADTESISERNVARYILAMPSDEGKGKAAVAARLLASRGMDARPFRKNAAAVLHRLGPRRIVVSATDTAESRRALATELPRMVLDGANAEDEPRIEVARLAFPPDGPCLSCLYPASDLPDDLTARMSRDLGLSVEEIQRLRETGRPLDQKLRQVIAKRSNILLPEQALGEGIDTAYTHHYCGSEVATTQASAEELLLPARVFAPTMAGVFLAVHLVKLAQGGQQANWFTWDLRRGPNPDAFRNRVARSNCPVCSDGDYQAEWVHQHGTEARDGH